MLAWSIQSFSRVCAELLAWSTWCLPGTHGWLWCLLFQQSLYKTAHLSESAMLAGHEWHFSFICWKVLSLLLTLLISQTNKWERKVMINHLKKPFNLQNESPSGPETAAIKMNRRLTTERCQWAFQSYFFKLFDLGKALLDHSHWSWNWRCPGLNCSRTPFKHHTGLYLIIPCWLKCLSYMQ